jgi:hypothetical protein
MSKKKSKTTLRVANPGAGERAGHLLFFVELAKILS